MAHEARTPRFIAVDWGTTRLRATLVDVDGRASTEMASDLGVQSVAAGGFPQALDAACGPLLAAHPGLPVIMAGMVGSRNGWTEVPYLACPCAAADAARRLTRLEVQGRDIFIVPGADCRWDDGSYDVMRGEETQAFGAGIVDGLVCLPGTHSKWVVMEQGRMTRFATFITGELYAALSHSFVCRLAEGPDDPSAAPEAAARVLRAGGGLTRAAFQARSRVLGGTLRPQAVRPYVSRLLIEAEIDGALDLFDRASPVRLVAGDPQFGLYRAALEARGVRVTVVDPVAATLAGLDLIMTARTRA